MLQAYLPASLMLASVPVQLLSVSREPLSSLLGQVLLLPLVVGVAVWLRPAEGGGGGVACAAGSVSA